MPSNIILTFTGPDRVGLVEAVTKIMLDQGGNVETSRMTRLGGAFAILMLVSIADASAAALASAFETLMAEGYKVTISASTAGAATLTETIGVSAATRTYQIEVRGADHEGIVYQVAQSLASHGINIESVETETSPAPMSGDALFSMTALVTVPRSAPERAWQAELQNVARRMNVDIDLRPLERSS